MKIPNVLWLAVQKKNGLSELPEKVTTLRPPIIAEPVINSHYHFVLVASYFLPPLPLLWASIIGTPAL